MMSNIIFKDCEYRYLDGDLLRCSNMKSPNDDLCDNCKENIHLNCDNYSPKRDLCLKFFQENISSLKECNEKTVFNDKELSRKWSN